MPISSQHHDSRHVLGTHDHVSALDARSLHSLIDRHGCENGHHENIETNARRQPVRCHPFAAAMASYDEHLYASVADDDRTTTVHPFPSHSSSVILIKSVGEAANKDGGSKTASRFLLCVMLAPQIQE